MGGGGSRQELIVLIVVVGKSDSFQTPSRFFLRNFHPSAYSTIQATMTIGTLFSRNIGYLSTQDSVSQCGLIYSPRKDEKGSNNEDVIMNIINTKVFDPTSYKTPKHHHHGRPMVLSSEGSVIEVLFKTIPLRDS